MTQTSSGTPRDPGAAGRPAAHPDAPRPGAGVGRRRGGERRSTAGIVIPATARSAVGSPGQVSSRSASTCARCRWGPVLYDPEDRAEVELHGAPYVLLRERDIHAVAAPRVESGQTGLYL